MEYVQIPLQIALRASRVFRPMLPYVNRYKAERNRQIKNAEALADKIKQSEAKLEPVPEIEFPNTKKKKSKVKE